MPFLAKVSNTYGNKKPLNGIAGEVVFDVPGTYTWRIPAGVGTASVVAVGGGAGYGDGGSLRYTNNYGFSSGLNVTVTVGAGGTIHQKGANTSVVELSTYIILAKGGTAPDGGPTQNTFSYATVPSAGETFSNGLPSSGGGNGGLRARSGGSDIGGGGGAGGYGGSGGSSSGYYLDAGTPPTVGKGGGGAGGTGYNAGSGGGGGVGLYGRGADGVNSTNSGPGLGGSGGGNGSDHGPVSGGYGGKYGGGGGGYYDGGVGGDGAVRIIWPGNVRRFPDMLTEYL